MYSFNWLSATGTRHLSGGDHRRAFHGLFDSGDLIRKYWQTLKLVKYLADHDRGDAGAGIRHPLFGYRCDVGPGVRAIPGALYPFFGTMLGWLGVALTGSDTASNVLFGGLQKDHFGTTRT